MNQRKTNLEQEREPGQRPTGVLRLSQVAASHALTDAMHFERVLGRDREAERLDKAERALTKRFNAVLKEALRQEELGLRDPAEVETMTLETEETRDLATHLRNLLDAAEGLVDGELNLHPEYEAAALRECAHRLTPRGRTPERYFVQTPLSQIEDVWNALVTALEQGKVIELHAQPLGGEFELPEGTTVGKQAIDLVAQRMIDATDKNQKR